MRRNRRCIDVIPKPANITLSDGAFEIKSTTQICVLADARDVGSYLQELLQPATGYSLVAKKASLVGMSQVEHVDRNVRAVGITPDPVLMAAVLNIIAPVANICWKEGRPENDAPDAVEKQS
jgi:aryl-alcohol dehydrogenase-like predicted oxidoreductase